MDESDKSQKADNEKSSPSIEDKLKKLQDAGLMSDVRDVLASNESSFDDVDSDASGKSEDVVTEIEKQLDDVESLSSEDIINVENVDVDLLADNLGADNDHLLMSDSINEQDDGRHVVNGSIADESVADENVTDESIADETVTDETAADESVADETVADESVADESVADETVADAIDDIDDDSLSDLILPEGSDIKIEEIKFKHDSSHLDIIKKTELPKEVEGIWEKTIKEIVKEEEPEEVEEIRPHESLYDKLVNKFTRRKFEIEEYSFVEHGPLVDFTMPDGANYEEIDLYEVNAPYAYVRIIHDPDLHEFKYQVIEPTLTENEADLLKMVKNRLVETLDVNLKAITSDNAVVYIKKRVFALLKDYRIDISAANREKILYYITRDFIGYGEIDAMMRDSLLEDISCDGPNTPIFVYHKKHESIPCTIQFNSDDELDSFVIRVAQICGRHISISNPLLDATMPEGSRIQLTLGREVTTRGSTFTIRRFNENPMTPSDLINVHTFSTAMMAYMWLAVESSKSVVFAGGTASGKTTAMNAISLFIQPEMKIVSIEDTRELNLPHPNWIPGVTRESFAGESKGSIEMYELLRASLRQRPEYILVGEVRGAEAYVLFQAMSTGHTTFSTMHADSVQSVVHRLENPPINVPRIMMQALDIVAIQAQVKVGDERVRRCKSLTEIVGVDPRTGELLTNEVFVWNAAKDTYQYSGRSYIVESVMENLGWDELKVRDELKRRQEVLEWTRIKEIENYADISKIIVAYNREPQMMMKIVRQDLYG